MKSQASRRDVLLILFTGLGAVILSVFGVVRGVAAFWFPAAPYEPSKRNKIGRPQDFPKGETRMLSLDKENVFVFHDDEGIYAMSAKCTHLGCAVQETSTGFICPCHGSVFDPDGKNVSGPAPAPLRWLEIAYTPDGRIVINRAKFVPAGTASKLTVSDERA